MTNDNLIPGKKHKELMISLYERHLDVNKEMLAERDITILRQASICLRLSIESRFYMELYEAYAAAKHVPPEAAALMALYFRVAATSDSFSPASPGGSDPYLDLDDQDLVPVPAWVVVALVRLAERYTSGESRSLHDAAGLRAGIDGIEIMTMPFHDFEMLQRYLILRAWRVLNSTRHSDDLASRELAEFAQGQPEGVRPTLAFEPRSTLNRVRRARKILAHHGL